MNYQILQEGNYKYTVGKFEDTEYIPIAEYTVTVRQNNRLACNCMSGRIRKYCKHIDWVRAIRNGQTIPSHVCVVEKVRS